MEFELDRIQMNGFDQVLNGILRTEETMESIVPDACPDILRVVETDGTVCLTRKEAAAGRVEVSGNMKLSVLYVPDEEGGLRHMELSIPFTCGAEGREIGPGCTVVASARLCKADTRIMNPRKILARAEAAIDVMVYAPVSREVCTQVEAIDGCESVEQMIETKELYQTVCVEEKPFAISDDITLSAGKPAAAEILKSWYEVIQGESKIIGNKLIFKGSANIGILYRGEDNGTYTTMGELPFSQILEVSGVAEEAESRLVIALMGAECALSSTGEGRTVEVELDAALQAVVSETRTVGVLTDAYSIHQALDIQWENCPVDLQMDKGLRSQNVREIWELAEPAREVMDCRAVVSQVTQSREGSKLILVAQTELELLYVNEQGELFSARRTMEVPCPLELPEECACACRCVPVGDCYATLVAGGIELRFGLDFHYQGISRRQITAVSSISPGQEESGGEEQPSLVLRMLERGERLWDVAKTYKTTIADIVKANELENGSDGTGRLLLIPRRR
ncbi:MAG: DUF3794 domain-containing protein [Oscillospiraceae bacterium]|nr:DUF3794 domain-containing protein [Oscillospiraceae bacterium]